MYSSLISSGALLLTLVNSIAGSPLSKRGTAQDVNSNIYATQSGVEALTTDTSAFNSGLLPTSLINGIPILVDVVAIHVANRKGYVDATTTTTFSNTGTITVVNTVGSTVAISIPNGVEVLKSKKAGFQQAGQVPLVLTSLELLLNDHNTFSAAVVAKLTLNAADLARVNAGIAAIHNALEDGVAYFET